MGKIVVATSQAPQAIGPYSQAVSAGGFLFLSGQIALDPGTVELVSGGVEAEAQRCLRNLGAVLAAHGLDFTDVVKTTLYLISMADFEVVNRVYSGCFPTAPPARSTVAVAGLPRQARVEMDAIACERTV